MSKRSSSVENPSPSKMIRNFKDIKRPPIGNINTYKNTLIFQVLELDHFIGDPFAVMPGTLNGPVPIMRIFGVTKTGNSVCCHIHRFFPYFYVDVPQSFSKKDCKPFKDKLNEEIVADIQGSSKENMTVAVLALEITEGKNLVEYTGGDNQKFVKITVALPKFIPAVKRLLENKKIYHSLSEHSFTFFESNVDIKMRFMIDSKIMGCCWLELPAAKWCHRTAHSKIPALSRCQLEVDVLWGDFIAHSPEEENWSDVAHFRIHSFDIECTLRRGTQYILSEPKIDSVIQIANVVRLHGEEDVLIRNVFTLNTCAPIEQAEVKCFESEEEMLEAWAEFVREVDPDIFTGYNINHFDFPFLLERAKRLKVENFDFLGRIVNSRSVVKSQTETGRGTCKTINCEGRVLYDMWMITKRDFKLKSYKLNSVCQEILGEQKDDVHFSIITNLQNGEEQTRRRLAIYCIKDADLALKLLNHTKSFINDVELLRVAGVSVTSLMTKREEVIVMAQLLRHSREAGYFMPDGGYYSNSGQYEQAKVIVPEKKFYIYPLATLQFNSLYPSTVIAHNLCYTTLLKPNMKLSLGLGDIQITKTPANFMFVKSSVRPGLLPHILQRLLSAGKETEALLKETKDPELRAVLNARQLAYKISANSVCGFTGAKGGKLPCSEIFRSLTAYSRTIIEQTKQEVEQHYCTANGYEADANVIYGDNDCVIVNFKAITSERCMELGKEAADLVNQKFTKPIKLEFATVNRMFATKSIHKKTIL